MDQVILNEVARAYNSNLTIYQFCREQDITLPCFCYHAKLSIAGNCRMCLVEVNEALVVSCALPLAKGMSITTNSSRLRSSREGILEFLLVNHPLDCPICDQGGECDLQDITFMFGSDRGRFFGFKRAVDNLNCLGPLIKTIMTRCIHCSRCVRYIQEYGGYFSLGILGRGSAMEIGTYVNNFPMEELSANVIDLCPVGALTAMPHAFSYRPWELISFESIDIFDALGSSLRLDVVNNKIVRVLPVLDESCNEEWITNKARFSFDSLHSQRVLYPKLLSQGFYYIIAWPKAIYLFLQRLFFSSNHSIQAICSHFLDLSSSLVLKNFFHSFGCSNIFYENIFYKKSDLRSFYFFGSTLLDLERSCFFLFIALNLRLECPLLNSRLRKNYLHNFNDTHYYSLGLALNYLTFPVTNLGNSVSSLFSLLEGKLRWLKNFNSFSFSNLSFLQVSFNSFIQPLILLGSGIFHRKDADSVASAVFNLKKTAFFREFRISFIADFLGKLSFFDVNFNSKWSKPRVSQRNFLLLLGTHLVPPKVPGSFVVFQGPHKTMGLSSDANLILPVKSHGENVFLFFNLSGYFKSSKAAVTSFRLVFTDSEIFHILNVTRKRFLASNFSFVGNFYYILSFFSSFIDYPVYFLNSPFHSMDSFERFLASKQHLNFIEFAMEFLPSLLVYNRKLVNSLFSKLISNYYTNNNYSKNSKIMSLCSKKTHFSTFSLVQTSP